MKRIITFGVFDYFHLGHLRLFKHCKEHADYLIIAVQNGDMILKTKPNAKVLYTTEERKEIVSSINCVDEVVEYNDVFPDITKMDFDIFAIGEDQNHDGFQKAVKWCEENGKEVIRLQRTPNICSSDIKKQL